MKVGIIIAMRLKRNLNIRGSLERLKKKGSRGQGVRWINFRDSLSPHIPEAVVSNLEIGNFGQAQENQGIVRRHTRSMPHKKSRRLTPRSHKRAISGWKLFYINTIEHMAAETIDFIIDYFLAHRLKNYRMGYSDPWSLLFEYNLGFFVQPRPLGDIRGYFGLL